jgi:hypothetical protein
MKFTKSWTRMGTSLSIYLKTLSFKQCDDTWKDEKEGKSTIEWTLASTCGSMIRFVERFRKKIGCAKNGRLWVEFCNRPLQKKKFKYKLERTTNIEMTFKWNWSSGNHKTYSQSRIIHCLFGKRNYVSRS